MGRRQAKSPADRRRKKTTKGKSCPGRVPVRGEPKASKSITETAFILDDDDVALAVADILPNQTPSKVRGLMRKWKKPILKATIPGRARRPPTKAMLEKAKREVLRFYEREEALGNRSHVVKAFYLATNEQSLRFDWQRARARVRNARFDMKKKIDSWDECLAMSSGDTNALSEIFVCGTKKATLKALTSLVCHEGLHNLALRTRRGNPYLSEDKEHLAMALLGDPQLVHREGQAEVEHDLPEDVQRLALDLLAEKCPEVDGETALRQILDNIR